MNRISWTRRALRDLEGIHEYIAREDPNIARSIIAAIKQITNHLAYHPFMGKSGRREGTRELVVVKTPFIVIYRLQSDSVEIIRILHGAQKYP